MHPKFQSIPRIQAPVFQFDEEDLFDFFLFWLKEHFNQKLEQISLTEDELSLLKQNLKEILSGSLKNFPRLLFEIKDCENIFQKNSDLSATQRITLLGQIISEFILSQKDQFEVEYKSFLRTIQDDADRTQSNEECMKKMLYKIPIEHAPSTHTFDRRFFFTSRRKIGVKFFTFILPLNSFMYEVVGRYHEGVVLEAEKVLQILNRLNAKASSIHGKILEMLYIQNAINSRKIFLGTLVDIDYATCFEKEGPVSLDKSKNVLYFPSSETYSMIDAVLVHHKAGKSKVSFIQITRIQKRGFAAKLKKIQQDIGLLPNGGAKRCGLDSTAAVEPNIRKWMEALVKFGFTSENIEFDFWIIYRGNDSYMKANGFDMAFNHLCFNDSGDDFREFLNIRSADDYSRYYDKICERNSGYASE
jgi:hypothetical protein